MRKFMLAFFVATAVSCSGGSSSTTGRGTFVSMTAEEAYQEGIRLHREGDLAGAEAALRRSIEDNPRYLAAYLALGRVLLDAQRPEDALEVFDQAVAIRDRNGEAHWGRSAALLAMNRPQDAITAANAAIERGFTEEPTLVLAMAYDQMGDRENAMHMLEQALQDNSALLGVRIRLAQMYIEEGRPGDAVPLLERAAYSDTENVEAWVALAQLHQQLEHWDRAVEAWQRVAELRPDDPSVQIHLAENQIAMGNGMMAIQALDDAIRADPNNAHAYVLRGQAQLQRNFLDQAQADVEAALRIEPDNIEALQLLAEIYTRQGDLDQAVAAYQGLVQAHPEAIGPAVGLARIQLEREDPQAALAAVQPHIAEAGSQPDLTETLFSIYHALGDDNQALQYIVNYVQGQPASDALYLQLVQTAVSVPSQTLLPWSDIVSYAEQAVQLSGGYRVEYWVAYIDALVLEGDLDRARQVTEAALQDLPNNPDLRERQHRLEE